MACEERGWVLPVQGTSPTPPAPVWLGWSRPLSPPVLQPDPCHVGDPQPAPAPRHQVCSGVTGQLIPDLLVG